MGSDASLSEPHIAEVLVRDQRAREMPSLFAPLKDLQLQIVRNIMLPHLEVMTDVARQFQLAVGVSVLRSMPQTPKLDLFVQAQIQPLTTALRHLADSGPLTILSQQQRNTAATIASFRALTVPTPRELHEAEVERLSRRPVTPQQIEDLEQAVASAADDPKHREQVERAARALGLTPHGLALVLVLTCVLLTLANSPLMADMTPTELAALSNTLAVILVVVAAVIQNRR